MRHEDDPPICKDLALDEQDVVEAVDILNRRKRGPDVLDALLTKRSRQPPSNIGGPSPIDHCEVATGIGDQHGQTGVDELDADAGVDATAVTVLIEAQVHVWLAACALPACRIVSQHPGGVPDVVEDTGIVILQFLDLLSYSKLETDWKPRSGAREDLRAAGNNLRFPTRAHRYGQRQTHNCTRISRTGESTES